MRFLFFLGPLCEGTPPAGGGGENLFPGDYDYIRQGHGHNVCLLVSRDGEHIDSKQCLLYNKDYPTGLTCHVRDPKVFAYEGRYYMVLGAAVALPDGAEQAVDVCFDLTAAPAGDFSLAFDGGLTLAYADASRMGL